MTSQSKLEGTDSISPNDGYHHAAVAAPFQWQLPPRNLRGFDQSLPASDT